MLDSKKLGKKLAAAADGGLPTAASAISLAIKTYCESEGTPVYGINVQLLPCTGAGWLTLALNATGSGVGDMIIKTAVATELSGSLTTVVTPTGPVVKPSTFNLGASVKNLKECTDYLECWQRIADAIVDFLKPELV